MTDEIAKETPDELRERLLTRFASSSKGCTYHINERALMEIEQIYQLARIVDALKDLGIKQDRDPR